MSEESDIRQVAFKSNFFGIYTADLFVPPNTIDFAQVFSGDFLEKLAKNYVVLATICVLLGIYLAALLWARRRDVQDRKTVSLCVDFPNSFVVKGSRFESTSGHVRMMQLALCRSSALLGYVCFFHH